MRRYELMLLFRPDLEDDKLQSAVEKVTRAIVNAGGALTKVSPWGKRRMAYEIQHFREASYFLLHFDIAPSAIREIERGLLISEEILRHLVTVLEDRGQGQDDDEAEAGEAVAPAMDRAERYEPPVVSLDAVEIPETPETPGEADAVEAAVEIPEIPVEADAVEAAAETPEVPVEADAVEASEAVTPAATPARSRRVAKDEES
jgi:small subunit ribosomal protein S6